MCEDSFDKKIVMLTHYKWALGYLLSSPNNTSISMQLS